MLARKCLSLSHRLTSITIRNVISSSSSSSSSSCICGFRTCLDICPAQSAGTWKPIDDHQDLAPYLGSSSDNIVSMLQFGNFVAGEHLLDIGAGDGRVLLEAIRQGAATATGYELSEEIYRLGLSHIASEYAGQHALLSLPRCQLLHQDALQVDFNTMIRSYDLITMFLLPRGLLKVTERLMNAINNDSMSRVSDCGSDGDEKGKLPNKNNSSNRKLTRIVTQGWPLPLHLFTTNSTCVHISLQDTITLSKHGGSTLYLYHISY